MGLVKRNNCYFPGDWNEVKVMKTAITILENPETVKLEGPVSFKKLIIEGIYNNTEIRIIFGSNNKLITLYPRKMK